MLKHVYLIHNCFLTEETDLSGAYAHFKKIYDNGAYWILLNNVNVFGPFPKANVPWDISEAQKIAIYNPEVTKVLNWINTRIVINLSVMDYKTLDVLVRIATGMLNKCNIPQSVKILFHDNMVVNLHKEHNQMIMSDLPFLGRKRKGDSYSPYPPYGLCPLHLIRG